MPKIELLINNQVLPSNMSVYQALKTYSAESSKDADNEAENSFMNNAIWSKLHMIYYRLAQQPAAPTETPVAIAEATTKEPESAQKRITRASHSSTSLAAGSSAKTSKALSKCKTSKSDLDAFEQEQSSPSLSNTSVGIASTVFYSYLTNKWPSDNNLSLNDQSIESISLLRILNALNRNWYMMYSDIYGQDYFIANSLVLGQSTQAPAFLVNSDQFVNSKLTAKANRQLQDPLVIMTGHLPKW
jgi:E3 ubiquitin-protein ligase TRIP12